MQCQHLLVKFYDRRCSRHASVEVVDRTSGFLDVTRRAFGGNDAMTGYRCLRIERLDLIERGQPLAPGFFIAFGEIGMRVVIDASPDITMRIEGT